MREIEKLLFFHVLKEKQYERVLQSISAHPELVKSKLGPQQHYPLQIASQLNDTALISFFLPDADEDILWESMVTAVCNGRREVCHVFFALPQAEKCIQRRDEFGKKLIHHAAIHGQHEILMDLQKLGYNLHESIDRPGSDEHDKNVLQLAMEHNQLDSALFLYQQGYKTIGFCEKCPRQFIHLACMLGFLPLVQAYANEGGDLNLQDRIGQSLLVWACSTNQKHIVDFLISKGVNINSPIQGELSYRGAPIFWAVLNGHTAVVEQLLKAGADTNMLIWTYGHPGEVWTQPYQFSINAFFIMGALAAVTGFVPVWYMLPTVIFNVNTNNNVKYTLLHVAAQEGYLDIVKLLIEQASQTYTWKHQTNAQNKTAQDLAEMAGHQEVANYLKGLYFDTYHVQEYSEGGKYKSHHMNHRPSFYKLKNSFYTAEAKHGSKSRTFSAASPSNHKVIVQTYDCEENNFNEQANMMKRAYPGEYRTFYISGHLQNKWQKTVRFVRPYFSGESATLHLQKLKSLEDILLALKAISHELSRLHRANIVLNQMSLDNILLDKMDESRYRVTFIDFSKSAEKQNIQKRITSLNLFVSQSISADLRLYANMLYQFLYEHPQGAMVASEMPALIEFIESSFDENKTTDIKSQFNSLFSLSTDWVDVSDACELTPMNTIPL